MQGVVVMGGQGRRAGVQWGHVVVTSRKHGAESGSCHRSKGEGERGK